MMNNRTQHTIFKSARAFTLYIIVAGVACVILTPVLFLLSLSLMSDFEAYNLWPLPVVPATEHRFRYEKLESGHKLSIFNAGTETWQSIAEGDDLAALTAMASRKTNCNLDTALMELPRNAARHRKIEFAASKNLAANYSTFFRITQQAKPAFFRSISVTMITIVISLSIGSMAGYAFARYRFRGKNALKVSVIFVRMFPGVAVAIPMVILLGRLGLYDQPLGLSLVYAVGQIGLTVWITASIFLGIPRELEEAAQIFGTTRVGAFWHITLPLAMPGLAACAMYSFITSWNETVQAIILTQLKPTFSVVVYQSLVGAGGMINLTAAGGITMALPAVLFTLIIRKYVLSMWGGVKL